MCDASKQTTACGTPPSVANSNDHGKTVAANLVELLGFLDLETIEDLEEYCEDDTELLLSVFINPDGLLEILSIATSTGTGLEFPFSVEWLHETLNEIEDAAIPFSR